MTAEFVPYMNQVLDQIEQPNLQEAMRYSLLAGGKRLRPRLFLAVLASFNHSLEAGLPVASAIEFVHTYSLIHDDLPAMDNDDLRRGKPTSHKQFGEALAILAGDALLTDAFALVATSDYPDTVRAQMTAALSVGAGSHGMVAGQVRDMLGEHQQLSLPALTQLHQEKTGALLQAAMKMGLAAVDASERDKRALARFAGAFGLGFQIKDDILDATATTAELGKTANKDQAEAKNTFVRLLGLDGAKEALALQVTAADQALHEVSRPVPELNLILDYLK